MVKHTIINAQLSYALSQARHGDAIVLCDANMPVPNGCPIIDLSLVRGVPSLVQTLKAMLNDMVVERYQVVELMPQYNPEMYVKLEGMLERIPGGTVSKGELQALMPKAKAVVRTGDFGSCCTMVLYSASGMDKYMEKFDCSFDLTKN